MGKPQKHRLTSLWYPFCEFTVNIIFEKDRLNQRWWGGSRTCINSTTGKDGIFPQMKRVSRLIGSCWKQKGRNRWTWLHRQHSAYYLLVLQLLNLQPIKFMNCCAVNLPAAVTALLFSSNVASAVTREPPTDTDSASDNIAHLWGGGGGVQWRQCSHGDVMSIIIWLMVLNLRNMRAFPQHHHHRRHHHRCHYHHHHQVMGCSSTSEHFSYSWSSSSAHIFHTFASFHLSCSPVISSVIFLLYLHSPNYLLEVQDGLVIVLFCLGILSLQI